jgi:hypothetical protein
MTSGVTDSRLNCIPNGTEFLLFIGESGVTLR